MSPLLHHLCHKCLNMFKMFKDLKEEGGTILTEKGKVLQKLCLSLLSKITCKGAMYDKVVTSFYKCYH